MKAAFAFCLALAPATALAQSPSPLTVGSMNFPPSSAYNLTAETSRPFGVADTPTMRQEKLERALALREETTRLLNDDGGKLTRKHEAYVRRRAQDILAGH
jgi:hypothetical protein